MGLHPHVASVKAKAKIFIYHKLDFSDSCRAVTIYTNPGSVQNSLICRDAVPLQFQRKATRAGVALHFCRGEKSKALLLPLSTCAEKV